MRLGQQAACQTVVSTASSYSNVSQTHIAPWGDFGPLLEESRLEMTSLRIAPTLRGMEFMQRILRLIQGSQERTGPIRNHRSEKAFSPRNLTCSRMSRLDGKPLKQKGICRIDTCR
jgi:hypothetical protein